MAYFYDHLMRHVNYPRWANYVIDLFQLASDGPVVRVLELACGTGKMLRELSLAGYTVYGMDLSYEMVKFATARLTEASKQVGKYASGQLNTAFDLQACRPASLPLSACCWCGDMRNFAVAAPVDAVLCLYDSLNYCLEPREVRQVFLQGAACVRPGGLFIFDVCTQRNCRKNFRNYYERDNYKEFSYIRRAYFKPFPKIQVNEFFITNEISGGPPIYECHQQRIYALEEINKMIDPQHWCSVGCFDGMSRRPGTERSDRVHFVLKRL